MNSHSIIDFPRCLPKQICNDYVLIFKRCLNWTDILLVIIVFLRVILCFSCRNFILFSRSYFLQSFHLNAELLSILVFHAPQEQFAMPYCLPYNDSHIEEHDKQSQRNDYPANRTHNGRGLWDCHNNEEQQDKVKGPFIRKMLPVDYWIVPLLL